LSSESFFRCNKCYLVNLEFVDGVDNNCILIGDDRIQVSRARKKALMDALNNYINEVSK
ncbi:MAG: LytTR family transcriptional regulator, partial [Oscillospiraceae bacterium]|nr:LytTR family transcriptional regulator [Oscillospiraceae bacterium]